MRTHSEKGRNGQRRQGLFLPCFVGTLSICLLISSLLGLRFSRQPNLERLLQEGHRALAQGDYERAAALYEQAELRSPDPADLAFYLAEAKYQLARKVEGLSPELLEAEQLFRCCLDSSDPHRPHALCGLGNCLLHKADSSDEGSLRSALACYDLCLQSAGDNKGLAAAARYNREKARLLLLQFLPPPSDSTSDRPPSDDLHPHMPRPRDYRPAMPMQAGMDGAEGSVDPQSTPGDTKQDPGKDPSKNNEPPQPGKGNLPPIPDEVDIPPLSPHLAGEHLELAAKRVLQEHQTHHRRDEDSTAKGVKDW